ncbi:MAG: hypothetical protein JW748_06190 [Anaerolineales bacterium]|nr:hypothetical protein [Anaerolineales bacterium]
MDPLTQLLWIGLIAAVPVAAAGLLLRRSAAAQGRPSRRGMAGWVLIATAILMAVAVGFSFWRMNPAGG